MKIFKDSLSIKISIILAIGLFLIASCGTKAHKKIPLDSLDPKLKKAGSVIVKDIITSLNHESRAKYLLVKDYMTPMLHGRIVHNSEMYDESYLMVSIIIGKVSTYRLFEVIDKGNLKTMRYKLETDNDDMKFVELQIDVNQQYGLADYYLLLTSKDGFLKGENVLPKAVK